MLSRVEKEQRVIELYKQGRSIREIAHEVHKSFADIGSIIRKFTGLQGDDGKSKEQQDKAPTTTLSKDSQAFALFSEGKKPIEVAIKLDLKADVVDKLYQQFWRLEGLYQLNLVYKEIRRYLPSFLNLFRIMKQQRIMSEQDVVDALKYSKELPHLIFRRTAQGSRRRFATRMGTGPALRQGRAFSSCIGIRRRSRHQCGLTQTHNGAARL